jgi:hypothetical protein
MNQPRHESAKPSGLFPIFFVVACGIALTVFLQMVGLTWVAVLTLLIGLIGFGHYVLWGDALTREVAHEREAFLRQQAREREDQEGWRA